MSDFIANVKAILDISDVEKKLNSLNGKKYKINVDAGNSAKSIDNVNQSLQNTQKSANNLGNSLKKPFQIGSSAAIAAKGIQLINTAAKNATNAVKDFDDAVTDLRMATNESYNTVSKMVASYNEMGKTLGATTKEVTSSADAWLRQGKSIKETNTLIRDSMILSKVGQIDSARATEYLTSSMKGYKVSTEDALSIVDRLSAVDLVSATNAGGLAEAMSRTAVTANNFGVSMDKLLGYLAAVGETTQKNMSSVGEAFKTIFSRMSQIKAGKLELVDADGTTELLSDVEVTLKNAGVDLRKTVTEYNNASDVLDNLASKWNSLNQAQQNAIVQALGGTRQQEMVRALLANYDTASKYMDIAANSAGVAEEKFGAYLDSIEAKTKTLQASFESLAVNTFSTEMFGGIIDASTAILECLDNTNLLKGSLAGLAAAGAVKGFTMMAAGIKEASIQMNNFNSALKIAKSGNLATDEFQKLTSLTQNLSQSQLKAVVSCKALSTEQRTAILMSTGMSQAEAQAAIASMGLATAEGSATAATFSLSGAFKGLWATLMANPLILVIAGVTAAVSAYSTYKQKVEEARQAQLEAGNTAKESANSIRELYVAYNEASSAYANNTGSKESLESATESLLFALGVEQSQIEALKEEYGSLDEAINQVTYDGLKQNLADMTAGYKAAQDAMMEAAADSMGWFSGSSITVPTHGEGKKFAEVLQAAGYLEENLPKWSTSFYIGINDYGSIDDLISGYQQLLDIRDALEKGIDEGKYTRDELTNSDVYSDVNDRINAVKSEYEDVLDYVQQINETAAQLQFMDSIKESGMPESAAEFDQLKKSMIKTAEESGNFVGSQQDIENAITNTLTAISETYSGAVEASNAVAYYSERITELSSKLEEFRTMQSNIQSAMKDSTSATGLTAEEINNLEAAYGKLSGYDPSTLFEETANGVHLNSEELARLNEQLETKTLEEYAQTIKDIQASIYRERAKGNDTSALEQELQQAKLLKSEYEGLTSAYNKWLTAKSGGNERDSYESVGKGYEDMQKILNEGWYGDDSLNAYLDLLLSAEQRTGDAVTDFEKLNKTIEGTSHSLLDYWKFDKDNNLVTDGLYDFLDDVNTKLGDSFAKVNEDGLYEFDFDGDKLKQVADAFGTSTEMVELFERAMIDAGMAVDMSDKSIVDQINDLRDSLKGLQEDGKLSDGINLDFDVDKDPIEDVRSTIEDLKSERVKIDAETNPEAAKELDELIAKCEQQYYFRLDAENDGALSDAAGLIKQMKELTTAPLSVETRVVNEGKVQELAGQLAALPEEVQIAVGIKPENVGDASSRT